LKAENVLTAFDPLLDLNEIGTLEYRSFRQKVIEYTEAHGVNALPQSVLWIGPKVVKPVMTPVTNTEELQNALTHSIKERRCLQPSFRGFLGT